MDSSLEESALDSPDTFNLTDIFRRKKRELRVTRKFSLVKGTFFSHATKGKCRSLGPLVETVEDKLKRMCRCDKFRFRSLLNRRSSSHQILGYYYTENGIETR